MASDFLKMNRTRLLTDFMQRELAFKYFTETIQNYPQTAIYEDGADTFVGSLNRFGRAHGIWMTHSPRAGVTSTVRYVNGTVISDAGANICVVHGRNGETLTGRIDRRGTHVGQWTLSAGGRRTIFWRTAAGTVDTERVCVEEIADEGVVLSGRVDAQFAKTGRWEMRAAGKTWLINHD